MNASVEIYNGSTSAQESSIATKVAFTRRFRRPDVEKRPLGIHNFRVIEKTSSDPERAASARREFPKLSSPPGANEMQTTRWKTILKIPNRSSK